MTALLRHDTDKKFLETKPYYTEEQGNFSRYSFSEYRPEIIPAFLLIPMET